MSLSSSLPPSQQAQAQHVAEIERDHPHSAWTGWITFASALLVLSGMITVFQGILALFDEGYFLARAEQLVLIDYDVWGVLLIAWGCVLLAAGAGLGAGRGWARWFAALAVMVHAIAQIGFLPSHPFLSVTLLAFDVVVLYALTVRWSEAQRTY